MPTVLRCVGGDVGGTEVSRHAEPTRELRIARVQRPRRPWRGVRLYVAALDGCRPEGGDGDRHNLHRGGGGTREAHTHHRIPRAGDDSDFEFGPGESESPVVSESLGVLIGVAF